MSDLEDVDPLALLDVAKYPREFFTLLRSNIKEYIALLEQRPDLQQLYQILISRPQGYLCVKFRILMQDPRNYQGDIETLPGTKWWTVAFEDNDEEICQHVKILISSALDQYEFMLGHKLFQSAPQPVNQSPKQVPVDATEQALRDVIAQIAHTASTDLLTLSNLYQKYYRMVEQMYGNNSLHHLLIKLLQPVQNRNA